MSYPILYSKNEGVRTPAIAGIAVAGLTIVGDATEQKTAFENQGLGTLSDAITCYVNEKRNGEYELEMQYPISGVHFSEIEQRSFILAKPNYTDNPQPFRVYKITKPLNGVCTIYARHISYDLSGFEMPAGRTAPSLSAACSLLTSFASPFTIRSTKSGTTAFRTKIPSSVRSWLGGKEGSLLDLYGGEWHWDGYTCILESARGTDRGVTIRYGKNLTELTQEMTSDNLFTAVRPYYLDADDNLTVGGLVATGLILDESRILFLDCGDHFGSTVPTPTQLTEYAGTYIQSNNLTTPDINISLDFVQLGELKDRVDLCDTVKVEYEALGVSATEKCIEVTWDVIRDRYSKAIFGTVKPNIATTVYTLSERTALAVTPSVLEQSVQRATSMITGNLGGYVILHDSDGNGEPDEILIMNTPDINTATKVWRWNKNGLGYSSTGYDGTYGLAMTADGEIVADFITTGQLTSIAINNGNGTFSVDESGHLVASDADITGDITANSLTLGSGVTIPYSKVSGKPDLTIYVQKDGTIGSTPAEGATGFVVSSAGLLRASNAVIYGTLYASAGRIANWAINANYLGRSTDMTSGVAGTQYQAFIQSPNSATSSAAAFCVRERTYDGSTYGSWTNNFLVTYGGKLTANNADITGKITATSGTIGGWTIDSNSIYKNTPVTEGTASTQYRFIMSAPDSPTSSNVAISCRYRSYDGSSYGSWTNNFYVSWAGSLYANKATITGTINATAGVIGGFTVSATQMTATASKTYSGYTATDYNRVRDIIMGTVTPTAADYARLDVNEDGYISSQDYVMIKNIVNNYGGTWTKASTIRITPNNIDRAIVITSENSSGTEKEVRIGANSISAPYLYSENIGVVSTGTFSTTTVATATLTTVATMSLAAGVWVIMANTYFTASFTQAYNIRFSGLSTSHLVQGTGANGGGLFTGSIENLGQDTTVSFQVYQASGSNKTLQGYFFRAVRIR